MKEWEKHITLAGQENAHGIFRRQEQEQKFITLLDTKNHRLPTDNSLAAHDCFLPFKWAHRFGLSIPVTLNRGLRQPGLP